MMPTYAHRDMFRPYKSHQSWCSIHSVSLGTADVIMHDSQNSGHESCVILAISQELYSPHMMAPWPWSHCATLRPKPCLFPDSAPPLLGDNPCWVAGIYVRFRSIKACAFEPQNDPSSTRLGFHSVHCRLSLAQWRMRFYIDCWQSSFN